MALEAGVVYIEDLVAANPVGATDFVDEGDDHIRNLKTAVKGSFPNLGAAAVTATAAELNRADLTAATGIVTAEELLTTDASKDIGTFNNITSTTFTGALTGNADTATTAAAVSDNVIGSNKIKDTATNVTAAASVGASATVTVTTKGILFLAVTAGGAANVQIEVDVNGTWYSLGGAAAGGSDVVSLVSTGSNIRLREISAGGGSVYSVDKISDT